MDMQNTGAAALTVYDRICLTRKNGRATAIDYIESGDIFTDFCELHGDRTFGDDHAVIGGIAGWATMPVTVIGIDKGRDLKERLDRHFGCVLPEGYRKALRLIKQAEKFNRPVICFVDTQGANCGKGAEERGAGEAIARNLYELSAVRTPIITVMIGEGGSGGCTGAGSRRPRVDAEQCVLLRHFAGILRKHPVQGSQAGAGGGGAPGT